MSNLTVIHQQEVLGQGFKVYGTVEEPLFLAQDVANWIEIKNVSQMLNVVDEDEKLVYTIYIYQVNKEKLGFLRKMESTNCLWFLVSQSPNSGKRK